MEASIAIRYTGPALETGRMSVYQAATNMLAFSEFMVIVVKATFGDEADAKAEVSGFEHGSFVTDLVITYAGPAVTMFAATGLSAKDLWDAVSMSFKLWKHLKGEPPARIEAAGDGQVAVVNSAGAMVTVTNNITKIVFSPQASQAVSKFVREGLDHSGYEQLFIGTRDIKTRSGGLRTVARVSAEEAPDFVAVAPESRLSDNTLRMTLILVAPVFQDGNKWRFSDGTNTFSAAIEDEDFLASVDAGERFGKGDVLDVDIRFVQIGSPGKILTERTIVHVHKHSPPSQQIGLEWRE